MEDIGSEPLVRMRCKPCKTGVQTFTPEQIQTQLEVLPHWRLTHDGRRIRRDWQVRHFLAGIDFFHQVAELAEQEGHHPDLHLESYRHVWIELWTHAVGGSSENDFILAAKIDRLSVDVK